MLIKKDKLKVDIMFSIFKVKFIVSWESFGLVKNWLQTQREDV